MLHAATYLGENTVAALSAIVEKLSEASGQQVVFEQAEAASSEDAHRNAATLDVVWMCGALFADMNQAGELDHDVVAVPVFGGEVAPVYRSVIVARTDGPDSLDAALEQRVAINEHASWSGHRALRHHVGDRWFRRELVSGSHNASIEAVASGAAECAAIDSSIWTDALLRDDSLAAGLRVIDQTIDWPAPPIMLRRSLAPQTRDDLTRALLDAADLPGVVSLESATSSAYDIMKAEEQ
jgi:ABC-type phosphate/phosphonate transport system substrate-binding protein